MDWPNRITRAGTADPAALLANPRNWRTHPQLQAEALRAVLSTVGYVQDVIVNETTGLLLDGHLRVQLAREDGQSAIPVKYVRLSVEEEALVLTTFDPLAALAQADAAQLADLLSDLNPEDAALAELLSRLADDAGVYTDYSDEDAAPDEESPLEAAQRPTGSDAGPSRQGPGTVADADATADAAPLVVLERGDVPDALWPSDNPYGIPLLDLTLCADGLDTPLIRWGSIPRTARIQKGTLHFYTDDYKFSALWTDPTPVPNGGWPTVVEPNFSCYTQMPAAVALWHIYRKRWLARYWQSRGVRIFVDLNVSPMHAQINLLGVPKGWRAWATRGVTARPEQMGEEYERAVAHAGTPSILFLVYGGGQKTQALCRERGWIWQPEESDLARGDFADAVPALPGVPTEAGA